LGAWGSLVVKALRN